MTARQVWSTAAGCAAFAIVVVAFIFIGVCAALLCAALLLLIANAERQAGAR